MKNLKILMAIIITIAFTTNSCKKDPNTIVDPTPTAKACFVNKMDNGADGYSLIEYNANHQVTKVTDYDSIGIATGTHMDFDYANNLMQSMISYDGTTIDTKVVMHYTASKIDKADLWQDDGSGLAQVGYYNYTYTGNDITKVEMYYEYMGVPINVSKAEFTYSNGNVVSKNEYTMGATFQLELSGTYTYDYDSKKNPMNGIGIEGLIFTGDASFMSKNNYTKETMKDASGTVQQDQSTNYIYEYNTNNYPTKSTSTVFDNSYTSYSIYTYDCF